MMSNVIHLNPDIDWYQRDTVDAPVIDPQEWQSGLHKHGGKDTPPVGNLFNACLALAEAPEWQGVLQHDEFSARTMMVNPPPWHTGPFAAREVRDVDITRTATWLQNQRIQVSGSIAAEAIAEVAESRAYHTVRGYLDGLAWDGTARIDSWLIDYAGAVDTALCRAIAAKFLISAVARVRKPGCKVDTVLILEGRQGLRKSSALAALAQGWFTDHMPDLSSKDAALQLQGVWIVEFAELDKLHRAEASKAKAFISTGSDRLRAPYRRAAQDYPRQCVFCGTVNPGAVGYLQDETGNRRFWPIACGVDWPATQQIDAKALAEMAEQLWAEADYRYAAGEAWWLDSDKLDSAQADAAAARMVSDVWQDKIADYLDKNDLVSIPEILSDPLDKPAERWTHADTVRVGRILTTLGWVPHRVRGNDGTRVRRYSRA